MNKPLYLLLLIITLPFTGVCQSKTEDVLYLKNGSVIHSKIVTPGIAGAIKVELQGGSIFVFQQEEIDSIKKQEVQKARLQEFNRNYYRKDHGYRNITELGLIYGPGSADQNIYYYNYTGDDFGLSIHSINGYQFWPYLFTGIGVGIDRFATYKQTFSPFYIRVASELLKKRVTPYIFADGGYSIMWKQKNENNYFYENKGGLYVSTGAGVRIYTHSRASVTLSAGYKRTSSQTTSWYNSGSSDNINYYTTKRTYHRLVIALGVTF